MLGRNLSVLALALCLGVGGAAAGVARAGLYDDEKKVTSGDVKDLDYWHAKFYHLMLGDALKTHQPEYLVGMLARGQEARLPDLVKKFPNHEDLKKWQAECEEIDKKVDKNADRTAHWKPDFVYWDTEAYRQAWVNMNMGRMEEDAKNWPDAYTRYNWALTNLTQLTDEPDTRMKNWPDEIVKWVGENKDLAEKKAKEMKAKT